ncbi:MAG: cupredoxin domain-containing protein [Chloroflexi bacterium]|nr:cupredoxin domain-containing protein [Chloroflexota bacterium]
MHWWFAARSWRWLIAFVLLALGLLVVPLPKVSEGATHHITLDAKQFEFAPGRVHVNQGDRVIITLTASDVVHGFYLDGYGLETRVEPGVSQKIEFVADKAGKFRYRCAVNCGSLHPFMIGELVVDSNTPFWRAIALVLFAVTGMLVYLWQSGKTSQEVTHGTI